MPDGMGRPGVTMRVLLAVLVVSGVGAAEAAPPRFEVLHRALPNLVYELDCVSGAISQCSLEAYKPLWESKFLSSPEDRAAIEVWKAIRAKYSQSVELPLGVTFPLGERGNSLSLFASARKATMMATSVDDLINRLDVMTLPHDRDAMADVVRRFEPRFRVWWASQSKSGDAFAADLSKLLMRLDVRDLIMKFQAFYEAPNRGDRALPFLVLDRPAADAHVHTFGEQVDGVSLIEVPPGDKATNRLDVVVHELCHYFYFTARPESIAAFQAAILASKVPGAIGAYRLFDEAMATALGNGLVGYAADRENSARRLARVQGFYNDPDIDRAAKALYAWVRVGSFNARISDPTFAAGYLEVLSKEYGESLAAPRLSMFTLLMFVDQRLTLDVDRVLSSKFHVNNNSSLVGLPEEPEVDPWYAAGHGTGLFIVPPEGLGELVKKKLITGADQKALTEAKGGAMLGKPRGTGEWTYVIVAADQPALERLFDQLAAAKGPLEGFAKGASTAQ